MGSREARRRHTHVAAISLEGEEKIDRLEDCPANWEEAILDDEFVEVVLQKWKKKDHRPTFKEMHAEDGKRRPSVTEYQSVDSDHPDIQHIQAMVADMKFGSELDNMFK